MISSGVIFLMVVLIFKEVSKKYYYNNPEIYMKFNILTRLLV